MTTATTIATPTVTVADIGPVQVAITERGAGRPFLLLHGGAGPQIETPGQLLRAIWDFADPHARRPID